MPSDGIPTPEPTLTDWSFLEGVPGIATDGVTDNTEVLGNAMADLGTSGGVIELPPGSVAVSEVIVPPSGVFLGGRAGRVDYGAPPSGYGTILTGVPGADLTAIVHLANRHSGLDHVGVDAFSFGTAVLLDTTEAILDDVWLQGGPGGTCLDSTSEAHVVELHRVYARSYNFQCLAIDAKGEDWIVEHVRTLGSSSFGAAGSLWAACHFFPGARPLVNATITGDSDFTGCYFDSVPARGGGEPIALILVRRGTAHLTGCRFFQNFDVGGFPIFRKEGGVVEVDGGHVSSPSRGRSGTFSCVIDAPNHYDRINGLSIQINSVPATDGVATLWGAGRPGCARGILYGNTLQDSVLTTVAGTTAGSAVWSMPDQDPGHKKVIVCLDGYENTTADAQAITFPTPFTHQPVLTVAATDAPPSGGYRSSRTSLILPTGTTVGLDDRVILEGF